MPPKWRGINYACKAVSAAGTCTLMKSWHPKPRCQHVSSAVMFAALLRPIVSQAFVICKRWNQNRLVFPQSNISANSVKNARRWDYINNQNAFTKYELFISVCGSPTFKDDPVAWSATKCTWPQLFAGINARLHAYNVLARQRCAAGRKFCCIIVPDSLQSVDLSNRSCGFRHKRTPRIHAANYFNFRSDVPLMPINVRNEYSLIRL